MKNDALDREARANMEAAKEASEKQFSAQQRLPKRYRLYDRIMENVSLRTIDAVIIITAALILVALIYGILTSKSIG